jgi:hypothetical protein
VSLPEIKTAIEQLSFEERAELAAWLHGWNDDECGSGGVRSQHLTFRTWLSKPLDEHTEILDLPQQVFE